MTTTPTTITLTDAAGIMQIRAQGHETDSPHLVVTPATWAEVMDDGETIIQSSPDLWSITHGPSGRSIGPAWRDPDELVALAGRLAQVGDWSAENPAVSWTDDQFDAAGKLVDDFRQERGIPTKWRE